MTVPLTLKHVILGAACGATSRYSRPFSCLFVDDEHKYTCGRADGRVDGVATDNKIQRHAAWSIVLHWRMCREQFSRGANGARDSRGRSGSKEIADCAHGRKPEKASSICRRSGSWPATNQTIRRRHQPPPPPPPPSQEGRPCVRRPRSPREKVRRFEVAGAPANRLALS